jgi:mannitol/fructose-specific phosphotransferase system IIA component (Ntr-type)
MEEFKKIIESCIVCLGLQETDGDTLIADMLAEAVKQGKLDAAVLPKAIRAVLNREKSASTAIPDGIALPHGRTNCVDKQLCMIGVHPQGIPFGAPDGKPTHLFVLMLVPLSMGCAHIQFLAKLSRCLSEPTVRTAIATATRPDEITKAIVNVIEGM